MALVGVGAATAIERGEKQLEAHLGRRLIRVVREQRDSDRAENPLDVRERQRCVPQWGRSIAAAAVGDVTIASGLIVAVIIIATVEELPALERGRSVGCERRREPRDGRDYVAERRGVAERAGDATRLDVFGSPGRRLRRSRDTARNDGESMMRELAGGTIDRGTRGGHAAKQNRAADAERGAYLEVRKDLRGCHGLGQRLLRRRRARSAAATARQKSDTPHHGEGGPHARLVRLGRRAVVRLFRWRPNRRDDLRVRRSFAATPARPPLFVGAYQSLSDTTPQASTTSAQSRSCPTARAARRALCVAVAAVAEGAAGGGSAARRCRDPSRRRAAATRTRARRARAHASADRAHGRRHSRRTAQRGASRHTSPPARAAGRSDGQLALRAAPGRP